MSRINRNQAPEFIVQESQQSVAIQRASASPCQPDDDTIQFWVHSVLREQTVLTARQFELCVRIVDEPEMCELNSQYRQRTGSTNVLSFPAEMIPAIPGCRLGDLVICAPVVVQQASEQQKSTTAHWAHMVVHGVLHLLGYDHIDAEDAAQMEQCEILILKQLGFSNPYEVK